PGEGGQGLRSGGDPGGWPRGGGDPVWRPAAATIPGPSSARRCIRQVTGGSGVLCGTRLRQHRDECQTDRPPVVPTTPGPWPPQGNPPTPSHYERFVLPPKVGRRVLSQPASEEVHNLRPGDPNRWVPTQG